MDTTFRLHGLSRLIQGCTCLIAFFGACLIPVDCAQGEDRCVVLELYVQNDDANSIQAEQLLRNYVTTRKGIEVRLFNVDLEPSHRQRFEQIRNYFQTPQAKTPAVYGCQYLLQDIHDFKDFPHQLDAMLRVTLFTRTGCPKCASAKKYMPELMGSYPAFELIVYDVIQDAEALATFQNLTKKYKVQAPSFPGIYLCNQLSIGYLGDQITGKKIKSILDTWTVPCNSVGNVDPQSESMGNNWEVVLTSYQPPPPTVVREEPKEELDQQSDSFLPLPGSPPLPGDGPLPPGIRLDSIPDSEESTTDLPFLPGKESMEEVTVPFFGALNWQKLGMPVFTIMIGLADGFNPCAMWVLLFLLSVLVNLKSRAKILAVAGTFVFISGLAYFAFMAAWMSVFMFVGYLRPIQIILGIAAVVIGSIHIKDFFYFKQGVSLSIPESAKPTIYKRVREIVTSNSMLVAIAGASVLAIMVNIVELLCTAGLPALYTEVLALQQYEVWKNYAYLGLYILAYMLDDSLMVGLVVITLGRRKMQETHGRWLKLISGLAIAALGIVMLFKPDWLI